MKAEIAVKKPKLIAVLGINGNGVFLSHQDGKSIFINNHGLAEIEHCSLAQVLDASPDRKPVYEGDSIIIQF